LNCEDVYSGNVVLAAKEGTSRVGSVYVFHMYCSASTSIIAQLSNRAGVCGFCLSWNPVALAYDFGFVSAEHVVHPLPHPKAMHIHVNAWLVRTPATIPKAHNTVELRLTRLSIDAHQRSTRIPATRVLTGAPSKTHVVLLLDVTRAEVAAERHSAFVD